MVLVWSIMNKRQTSCIKSLLKLVPWSGCKTSRATYLIIHSSTIALAIVAAVMSFNGTVTTYFVYRSEVTRMYLALKAKVTGPKMSAAITSNELKSCVDCSTALNFFPAVGSFFSFNNLRKNCSRGSLTSIRVHHERMGQVRKGQNWGLKISHFNNWNASSCSSFQVNFRALLVNG